MWCRGNTTHRYIYFAKGCEHAIPFSSPTQIYGEGWSTKEIKLFDTFSAAQVRYLSGVSHVRDLITRS